MYHRKNIFLFIFFRVTLIVLWWLWTFLTFHLKPVSTLYHCINYSLEGIVISVTVDAARIHATEIPAVHWLMLVRFMASYPSAIIAARFPEFTQKFLTIVNGSRLLQNYKSECMHKMMLSLIISTFWFHFYYNF